jgi:ABC-type Fe3+ transport system permease subunit
MLIFSLALTEFSASVWLVSVNTQVAATAMYNLQATGNFEGLSAASLVVLTIALTMFAGGWFIGRRATMRTAFK